MSNNPFGRSATGKAPPPPPPRASRPAPPPPPSHALSNAADVISPEALIGMMVGHFRIIEIIGYGGFGVVYLAEHVQLKQRFALKLVRAHQQHDGDLLKRFQREANTLAALHHPNIVRLKDFGQLGDHGLYFAMEYLPGRDLKEVLLDEYPLSLERIRRLVGQICDALRYMHSKKIYHRDMKPANVIVVQEPGGRETAKMIDFGIASACTDDDTSLTQTGMLMGSMPYISPEQARGDSALIDGRADLYSLGIMLYQLLTQELPYQSAHIPGLLTHHLFTPPPSLSKYRPHQTWSPDLDAFLQKSMAKKPEDRFPTAAIFWNELLQAFATQPPLEKEALSSTYEPIVDDSVEALMRAPSAHEETVIPMANEETVIPTYGESDSIKKMLLAAAEDSLEDSSFLWGEEAGDVEVTSLLHIDLVQEDEAIVELFGEDEFDDLGIAVAPTITDLDDEKLMASLGLGSPTPPAVGDNPFGPTAQSVVRSVLVHDEAAPNSPTPSPKRSSYSPKDIGVFLVFLLAGGVAAYFVLFHDYKTPKPPAQRLVLGNLPSLQQPSGRTQARAGLYSWTLMTLPAGATLHQNGQVVGRTPHTFWGKPKSTVEVSVVHKGFATKVLRWELKSRRDKILVPLSEATPARRVVPRALRRQPLPLRTRSRVAPNRRTTQRRRRAGVRRTRRRVRPRKPLLRPRPRPNPRPRKRIYDVADPF